MLYVVVRHNAGLAFPFQYMKKDWTWGILTNAQLVTEKTAPTELPDGAFLVPLFQVLRQYHSYLMQLRWPPRPFVALRIVWDWAEYLTADGEWGEYKDAAKRLGHWALPDGAVWCPVEVAEWLEAQLGYYNQAARKTLAELGVVLEAVQEQVHIRQDLAQMDYSTMTRYADLAVVSSHLRVAAETLEDILESDGEYEEPWNPEGFESLYVQP